MAEKILGGYSGKILRVNLSDNNISVETTDELCNAYSLDTIATGVVISFAMGCFENGLLNNWRRPKAITIP